MTDCPRYATSQQLHQLVVENWTMLQPDTPRATRYLLQFDMVVDANLRQQPPPQTRRKRHTLALQILTSVRTHTVQACTSPCGVQLNHLAEFSYSQPLFIVNLPNLGQLLNCCTSYTCAH